MHREPLGHSPTGSMRTEGGSSLPAGTLGPLSQLHPGPGPSQAVRPSSQAPSRFKRRRLAGPAQAHAMPGPSGAAAAGAATAVQAGGLQAGAVATAAEWPTDMDVDVREEVARVPSSTPAALGELRVAARAGPAVGAGGNLPGSATGDKTASEATGTGEQAPGQGVHAAAGEAQQAQHEDAGGASGGEGEAAGSLLTACAQHKQVAAFVWSVIRHIVPPALLGDAHNRR